MYSINTCIHLENPESSDFIVFFKMSAKENKTQNVSPCTKEVGCDLSPEDLKKIFAILKDKADVLKKVHGSLFVGGIKAIFDVGNPNVKNEEQHSLSLRNPEWKTIAVTMARDTPRYIRNTYRGIFTAPKTPFYHEYNQSYYCISIYKRNHRF